ncbi:hypothetical protein [Halobacillus yeomjeoni]|uniref:Uncharacterized protein n=1 Tax=Halobacillus yeomjeoni TaxID=311194 RepID=A0A931MTY0_9BACI|nr:hypothetical protein [Halobacillus yeomjeoni]MBH0229092.1 hypothetical protein [Halobacillus yeomjeoni]
MSRSYKVIKRIYNFYLEHFLILLFTAGIIGIMLVLQFFFSDLDKDFWISLIPNFIADMIGILITSYIIAVLLQRSEEKKAKEKAYKLTGNRYKGLISTIGSNFVHVNTGKPYGSKHINPEQEMKSQIKDVVDNIETYIPHENFIQYKKINILFIDGTEKTIDYQRFCKQAKNEIEPIFEQFINRYIGFLPDDLRESLLNVEILISKILVTSSIDFNLGHNIVVNYEEHIAHHKELGKELLFLISYFDECKD